MFLVEPKNLKEQLELWRAAARNKKEDDVQTKKKPLPHLHPLVYQLNRELHAAEKEKHASKQKVDSAEKEKTDPKQEVDGPDKAKNGEDTAFTK